MRLVVPYKYIIVLLMKLQVPGLVTLFTHINYITKNITSILLLIYILILFINSCCKLLKTDLSGEICTCATWPELFFFFPNADPHNWFIYLLLLSLKMSITISNGSFIWKYKIYARKSQNDANINQILKTLTWG